LAVSSFRLRARLDVSIPSSFSGQRGITPAFGYGAPHSSTRGTLTLLNNARLSALYNTVRLHSAIGYVTPQDRLAGRQAEIHAARDRKLEQARSQRQLRQQQRISSRFAPGAATMTSPRETEAGSAGTQARDLCSRAAH